MTDEHGVDLVFVQQLIYCSAKVHRNFYVWSVVRLCRVLFGREVDTAAQLTTHTNLDSSTSMFGHFQTNLRSARMFVTWKILPFNAKRYMNGNCGDEYLSGGW